MSADEIHFPDETLIEVSRDNAAHALDNQHVWLCVATSRGPLPNSSLLDRCTYGAARKRVGPRGEPWPPWPCQSCAGRVARARVGIEQQDTQRPISGDSEVDAT